MLTPLDRNAQVQNMVRFNATPKKDQKRLLEELYPACSDERALLDYGLLAAQKLSSEYKPRGSRYARRWREVVLELSAMAGARLDLAVLVLRPVVNTKRRPVGSMDDDIINAIAPLAEFIYEIQEAEKSLRADPAENTPPLWYGKEQYKG